MVKWAARHALEVLKDVQLGFKENEATITWRGFPGVYLVDLLPRLIDDIKKATHKPDFVIMHCGTNDIGSVPHHMIQQTLKSSIHALHREFPELVVFWSDIIPRRVYSVARSTARVDKARKKVNRFAHKLIVGPGGGIIQHDISFRDPELYFPRDEVHLSAKGNAILTADWSRAVREYLALWR